jgi:hypothetical protein
MTNWSLFLLNKRRFPPIMRISGSDDVLGESSSRQALYTTWAAKQLTPAGSEKNDTSKSTGMLNPGSAAPMKAAATPNRISSNSIDFLHKQQKPPAVKPGVSSILP